MLSWVVKVCLAIFALLPVGLSADSECLIKSGDRVVFLGDSITEQRVYTRYVMNYFALRYPEVDVVFRNAGWVSDTAVGGTKRLQRDVLDLKPSVVSICYGMNDAGVTAYDQKIYDRHINGITELVDTLQKNNIKVALITVGCVDESKAARLKGYNETLGRFARQLCEFAEHRNIPCYNIHEPMLEALTAGQADSADFVMMNDGVHPQSNGHMVMAYGLIKSLGCESQASQVSIDAATKKVKATGCRIGDLQINGGSIVFSRTDSAPPIFLDDLAIAATKYFPSFDEINDYSLQITGLRPGKWRLTVTDGKSDSFEVGVYSGSDLAKGVNLAYGDGPWKTLASEVNSLSRDQESAYYSRWRQVQLGNIPAAADAEKQALLDKLDSISDQLASKRREKAKDAGKMWRWSLKPTD